MSDIEKPCSAESVLSQGEPFCIGSHDGKTLFVIGENVRKEVQYQSEPCFCCKSTSRRSPDNGQDGAEVTKGRWFFLSGTSAPYIYL